MSVVAIGVNQRSLPLDVFEQLAVDPESTPKLLHDLVASTDIEEAVVLSTCNRVEIYAQVERFHPAFGDIQHALSRSSGLPLDSFARHLYVHHDEAAAGHLFGVTCGIDSAVLGETEILGQVRRALEEATEAGVVGHSLKTLFQASSTAGRKVRASTGIARNITSVSRAAVAMATERLGTLDGRSICVLGAGEMSEGMTVALRDAGARDIVVCNRTLERATELAERVGGTPVPMEQLTEVITDADLLLTGTGARVLMVDHDSLADIMSRRADRRLLIVDIAVPRDVDPAAADVPGVTLLDMGDLAAFAEIGRAERRGEIVAVREVIDDEVAKFRATTRSREVEPLVAAFRQQVEATRLAEIERVAGDLDAAGREALDAATRSIINKLMHNPMAEVRSSAGSAKGDRLATSLRDLFGIEGEFEAFDESEEEEI